MGNNLLQQPFDTESMSLYLNTVAGRATGASQVVGNAIVTTTEENSILTVRNPTGNAAALTVTPVAGGTRSVSAHLLIVQLQ